MMDEIFMAAFEDELNKIAQHPEGVPVGSKIRSGGKGQGLGKGGGHGPMGVPTGDKLMPMPEEDRLSPEEIRSYWVARAAKAAKKKE